MIRKGTTVLGDAITKVPAMILVFLIMLFYVVFAGIIGQDHENSQNIDEEFLNSYLVFEGNLFTVKDLIKNQNICNTGQVPAELGNALRKHFMYLYGSGDAFALVKDIVLSQEVYSWAGFMEERYSEGEMSISYEELEKVFDTNLKNVKIMKVCDNTSFYLYSRRGGL